MLRAGLIWYQRIWRVNVDELLAWVILIVWDNVTFTWNVVAGMIVQAWFAAVEILLLVLLLLLLLLLRFVLISQFLLLNFLLFLNLLHLVQVPLCLHQGYECIIFYQTSEPHLSSFKVGLFLQFYLLLTTWTLYFQGLIFQSFLLAVVLGENIDEAVNAVTVATIQHPKKKSKSKSY